MAAQAVERDTPAWSACFPIAALGAWAVVRIGTWFSRDYTHDDFYFAYLSWLRAAKVRPGSDVDVLLYTPLVEIFSPFFRLWPQSLLPLDLGRAFILAIALAVLVAVYLLARRLGASTAWALCAVSITAWQGDFLLRVSDIRTDPIATLFLLGSVLLLLRADASRSFLAGLCFGMAVFFNIKVAVASPAFGLLVAMTSAKKPVRALFRFAAGALLGLLLWDVLRVLSEGWTPLLTGLRALSGAPLGIAPPVTEYFQRAIRNAPISVLLLALGGLATIAAPLLKVGRQGLSALAADPRFAYGCYAVLFVAVFIRTNPFLFPYNFVILMPFLGPLLPGLTALLPAGLWPVARAALVALVTFVPISEGVAALSGTAGQTNLDQRRVVKWIWEATAPAERVFDWQGMHWGRLGTHHWWMFSGWLPAYQAGRAYSVAEELRAGQVSLVIDNYRLGWFNSADREFFLKHYARLDHCVFAPGREFTPRELEAGSEIDVFVAGAYRVDPPDAVSRLLVDGRPAARLLRLENGVHKVTLAPGAPPTIARIAFTTLRRDRAGLPCPAPTTLFYGF